MGSEMCIRDRPERFRCKDFLLLSFLKVQKCADYFRMYRIQSLCMAALYPDCTFYLRTRHSVLDKRTPLPFKQCHDSAVFHSTYAPCKYFCTQTAVPQYDCKCCLPGVMLPLRNLRSAIPFGKRCSCCGAFSSNLLVYPPQFHAGRHIR